MLPTDHPIFQTFEYKLIEEFYAGKLAKRSKAYKIYHVDEGLYILDTFEADLVVLKAFCLHPIVQEDADLKMYFAHVLNCADKKALMLALEYRNIANQYLSRRTIESIQEIALSPLHEVNLMLIADKIQNYKDFKMHLDGRVQNSDRLHEYFKN